MIAVFRYQEVSAIGEIAFNYRECMAYLAFLVMAVKSLSCILWLSKRGVIKTMCAINY